MAVIGTDMQFAEMDMQFAETSMQFAEMHILFFFYGWVRLTCSLFCMKLAEWDWPAVCWEWHAVGWDRHMQFAEIDMQFTCSLLRLVKVRLIIICSLLKLTMTCSLLSVAVCWDWHAICMQFAKTDFIYSTCSWLILTYCLLCMQLAETDILFTNWFTLHIHVLFTPHDIGMQITV